MQQRIADVTNEYIDNSALEIKNALNNKSKGIDFEKIIKANQKLTEVLKELSTLEEQDSSIKQEMSQGLYELK